MKKINSKIKSIIEKYIISNKEKGEIKKYKDKRRKDIYLKVNLTSEQQKEIDDLYEKNLGEKIHGIDIIQLLLGILTNIIFQKSYIYLILNIL